MRDPFRIVSPRASTGYNPAGCYPTCIMPFSIGDKLYMSHVDGSNEIALGAIAGIKQYGTTDMPVLLYSSDRLVVPPAGLTNGNATPPAIVDGAKILTATTGDFAYTHLKGGIQVYVKHADRLAPWTSTNIEPNLLTATQVAIDYTISDIQYQVKKIDMPQKDVDADLAAANSESGLQIDLETVQTRLTNQSAIQGPTQNLISIPNIIK